MRRLPAPTLAWSGGTLLAALAWTACGGKVTFDEAPDAGTPLPSPPARCEAAIGAIDWSACVARPTSPSAKDAATIYCAQVLRYPSCTSEFDAYYMCLASAHPVCKVYDAGAGSIGENVTAPACDAAQSAWLDCIATCAGGFSCRGPGWKGCTCSPAAPHAGASCAVYPAAAAPSRDCDALCFQCGA